MKRGYLWVLVFALGVCCLSCKAPEAGRAASSAPLSSTSFSETLNHGDPSTSGTPEESVSDTADGETEPPVYRMAPGELAPPYLLAPEGTPTYGIPYESEENMKLSCQLVRILAAAEAGTCPLCGDTAWVLAYIGPMDAAIDTLCWVPRCALKTYEEEDRANLTWPLQPKPGLTLETRPGQTSESGTLGEARGERQGDTVRLHWVGGHSCELPAEDVLTPEPALVSALQDGVPSWEELFAG